jgi:hypothetical protein
MSDGLVNVDADKPAGHVSELVFVFKKGKSRKMFGSRSTHIDVELFLIEVCNRREGHARKFDVRNVLGVHVDKSKGVSIESHIFTRTVSRATHDVLCVPLTETEHKKAVDYIEAIQSCPFNSWDSVLSATASLINLGGVIDDIQITDGCNISQIIHTLHAPQLVTLLVRLCIHPRRSICSKLWGFNSRMITADELYEQFRGTCLALDSDALRNGVLHMLG